MTLDLSPAPGAASRARRIRAQALMEARLTLRNGEQVLLAIVVPIIALVAGVAAGGRIGLTDGHRPIDLLTPGVLALAIMSTAFTSLAISTGFERRYGILKRLGASPLSRLDLLVGKVLALVIVQKIQLIVIAVVALALGWRPAHLAGFLWLVVLVALGTAAFAGLALALAGALRAEGTLAAANLVHLLLMSGGAVVIPRHEYGPAAEALALLPSAALGDALRASFLAGHPSLVALLTLAAWAVIGGLAAHKWFRWE